MNYQKDKTMKNMPSRIFISPCSLLIAPVTPLKTWEVFICMISAHQYTVFTTVQLSIY